MHVRVGALVSARRQLVDLVHALGAQLGLLLKDGGHQPLKQKLTALRLHAAEHVLRHLFGRHFRLDGAHLAHELFHHERNAFLAVNEGDVLKDLFEGVVEVDDAGLFTCALPLGILFTAVLLVLSAFLFLVRHALLSCLNYRETV